MTGATDSLSVSRGTAPASVGHVFMGGCAVSEPEPGPEPEPWHWAPPCGHPIRRTMSLGMFKNNIDMFPGMSDFIQEELSIKSGCAACSALLRGCFRWR